MVGTTHGAADYCERYYRQIVSEGIDAANPMLFAEGVPNVGSAHLSLALGLAGSCQSIIGSRTAGIDALRLAAARIATGRCDRVIVCAGEEAASIVERAYAACRGVDTSTGLAEGAVAFVVESSEAAGERGVKPVAYAAGGAASLDADVLGLMPADQDARVLPPIGWTFRGGRNGRARGGRMPLAPQLFADGAPELFAAGPLASIAAAMAQRRSGNHEAFGRSVVAHTADLTGAASAVRMWFA